MKKFAMPLIAAALLAPAVALAAVKPADGKFKQTLHYKAAGAAKTAKFTITVAKGQIKAIDMVATVLPYSSKLSHGYACSSVNILTTKGEKRSGKVLPSGKFNVTFKSKDGSDTETVVGRFTNPTHATGTYRDHFVASLAQSDCNTGKVAFKVAR